MRSCCFLSPFYNRRTDQYGGSWENRARLLCETLGAIRDAVGPDFPIMARISGDEFIGDMGITIDDTTQHIVPLLEKAGADCIDVSFGNVANNPESTFVPLYYPDGVNIGLAEAVIEIFEYAADIMSPANPGVGKTGDRTGDSITLCVR